MPDSPHHSTPANTTRIETHEVAEGRVVRGLHLHFKAGVYGEVVSDGGQVRLDDVLGWGRAQSDYGQIQVARRAFNSTLIAAGGSIDIARAESCLIIGREVRVGEAVNCKIVAHQLHAQSAVGCTIAASSITVGSASPRKGEPTVLTVVLPELPDLGELVQPFMDSETETQGLVEAQADRIEALKADAGLAKFLVIRGKVRAGVTRLTEEQQQGYAQMESRFGHAAAELQAAVAARRALQQALAATQAQAQALRDQRAALLAANFCHIAKVEGETLVRSLLFAFDADEEQDLSLLPELLATRLLSFSDDTLQMLFAGAQGRVDWVAGR